MILPAADPPPALMLPPETSQDASELKRINMFRLETSTDFIKLLASVHLLPMADLPSALIVNDTSGELLRGESMSDRALCRGACLQCVEICFGGTTWQHIGAPPRAA